MLRLLDYLSLARFDKPIGSLLLLWPTLWGLWLAAEGWPGSRWLVIFVTGVFAMRAFGCAVNDIVDRKLDAQVARTRTRPLAARRISVAEAAMVAAFFLLIAAALFLQLPAIAQLWALAGLALAAAYPLAKRIFAVPQMVLGAAFSFGIPIAYAAVRGESPPLQAWLFVVANWLWVLAYDTIYAMCDRDDDIKAGAKSSAVWLDNNDVTAISLLYAAAVLWLSFLGVWYVLGTAYQVALIAAMSLVFRFWQLYRTRQPAACLSAFRANHWFGAFVFAGLAAAFA
ncbi:4-hydroxybenzoate octaprenyltransferase [Candidatus Persebacteraceae bacterium Df01]|jgi:4-hydroxybenzoate polyprenyltransferase|uniref:4-hydroxybenzoate octaprenyltransferase n=1 Tax=Candidatus Doriopsillibacter californiensis TaxID=2970740 RepID=A0ABT7QKH4_9GAMM|nr:4-hydroxybenzoate octaprenyltransferase [Candidatus Persebacteraceae bacterium Df01]